MTTRREKAVARLVDVYRLLLRLHPPEQRSRYGAEMVQVFRAVCRRAAGQGRLGRVAAAELAVLVARGVGARLRRSSRMKVVDGGRQGRAPGSAGLGPRGERTRGDTMTGWGAEAWTVVRGLSRRPLHTGAFVVTLGLGIAAATATFAVADAVLLKPRRGGEVVELWTWVDARQDVGPGVRGPVLRELRTMTDLFTAVEGFTPGQAVLTDLTLPEQVASARVTPGLFRLFGVEPARGPGFAPEAGEGPTDAVVLSHGLWRRRYGSDPDILEGAVEVAGERRRVVGVMPAGFQVPGMSRTEVWLPLVPSDTPGGAGAVAVVARLRRGMDPETANETLVARSRAMVARGVLQEGTRPTVQDLVVTGTPGGTRRVLALGSGAVGLMLLVSVSNVLGLALARAVDRRPEWAVRKALGAGRRRMVLRASLEGTVLGLAAGAIGAGAAAAGLGAMVPGIPPAYSLLPMGRPLALQLGDAALALAAGALLGAGVGAVTGWIGTGALRAGYLRGSGGSEPGAAGRIRALLACGQVALSFLLLGGAGLLLATLVNLQRAETGYDAERLLVATLRPPSASYTDPEERRLFLDRVGEELRTVAGVTGVGEASSALPQSNARFRPRFETDGGTVLEVDEMVPYLEVSGNYFATAGVRVLRGRPLGVRDASTPEAVVSEGFVRRLWPEGDAVGRRFRIGEDGPWHTVVGVSENAAHISLRIAGEVAGEFYVHLDRDERASERTYVLRTDGDPSALVGPVRARLRTLDPNLPFQRVVALREAFEETVSRERFFAGVVSAFGLLGLVLSAVGLYGVLAHGVRSRSREIGIRVTLGADRRRILGSVVGRALTITLAGTVVGAVGGILLFPVLDSLLFGLEPRSPAALAATASVFLATASVAAFAPARHALSVDPVEAIRTE